MPTDTARPADHRADWLMLLALSGAFALSQAWRTIAAIMAPELQRDFGLSAQQLGLFAGTFHFAFGALQLVMGIGIDLHGVRRTVLTAFPLAVAGAALSALAPNFAVLLLGQALIGIGCAPAFLVCTVFIARRYPPERFASLSGLVIGLGGVGMLITGTPLAWLIGASSWRGGFVALGALSALAWLAIAWLVRDPGTAAQAGSRESIGQALRGFGALLTMPHTAGIAAIAAVGYASVVSLRGLWLGPMLVDRHAFSLITVGHVAVAVSLGLIIGPTLFGRLDPGPHTRRRWLVGFTFALAALFAVLALDRGAVVDVTVSIVFSLLSGFLVLQYADVRAAYPAAMTGRALALLTMAMFLGVALMQWITGAAASAALAWNAPVFGVVMGTIAALLVAGALAFAWLPQPPRHS